MAYAAVTSLMGTIDLHFLQSQPRLPLQHKQEIVNSLHENLGFLQEILEKSDEISSDEAAMKALEAEMRDVSFKAEERIEMELTTIYLAKGWTKRLSMRACLLRLDGIFNEAVKQTDYLKLKLIELKIKYELAKGSSENQSITHVPLLGSTSSQPDLERQNIKMSKFSKMASKFDSGMVGYDEEFTMILDQLMRQSDKQRQVVAIFGMGGIGKTTLAQRVYEDPSITSYFDKRAWTTVSQKYNVGQMLGCLLGSLIPVSGNDLHEQSNDQAKLAEHLRKCLKEQRYLIVINDIWSTTAWDSVQRCFPDDNNGSRILLTSRLKEVAEYAGKSLHNMRFLEEDESWNLYCKVFGKMEFLHDEIEKIGKHIVKKCKGLPLAIVVVAGLLSKTEDKVEKWRSVATNVSRYVIGDSNEACSRILSLSYNQLPHYLKVCFLYFGVFPENYKISVKKLVRCWAAEGFLKAVKHPNPEEVAMECLQDLVDRSLVVVSKQSYNGKMKTVRIHDLLRDLCLREAQRENLLNGIGLVKLPFYQRISQYLFSKPCRWISVIRPECLNNLIIRSKFFDKLHSIHCVYFGVSNTTGLAFSHFKLLRVVDMECQFVRGGRVLSVFSNLIHLRYLALTNAPGYSSFDNELFEHWNIQIFIVRGFRCRLDSYEAFEIWNMPQLRNFYVDEIITLRTPTVVHTNLENISWLDSELCTKDLFEVIPNLKKLGIRGGYSSENPDYFYNFVHLRQLEKLSISGYHPGIPCNITNCLPNLKKLSFLELNLEWHNLSAISMLPNLEVLKLINAWYGPEWKTSDGGFNRLKRLVIESTDLQYWNAVGEHFPVLECLEISDCYRLKEIPRGFADITSLALIQLSRCWDFVVASAKWIQNEQNNYGNDALLVRSKNIRTNKKGR